MLRFVSIPIRHRKLESHQRFTQKKLTAFEMYVYRRMLSYGDHVRNDAEVLNRMVEGAESLKIIQTRKLLYFGHIYYI